MPTSHLCLRISDPSSQHVTIAAVAYYGTAFYTSQNPSRTPKASYPFSYQYLKLVGVRSLHLRFLVVSRPCQDFLTQFSRFYRTLQITYPFLQH